jgi:short-subunit dehydrogenase
LKDSGVSVTALMPGATDSEIWDRAEIADTKLGASSAKDDPNDVAKTGYDALMRGEAAVVHGVMNKAAVAAANLIPDVVIAAVARHTSRPGSA